jgi:D-beta-D-heptose 7-phosphate kinase/D-beta-D-heptose 1-phosphate adenosyltransferase
VQSTRQELFETLDKIRGLEVLVVGDVILDRYIWGSVERISPEAPVPVVLVKRVEDRLGGAGNVVRNLSALGAKVSLSGFIGDDDEGRVVLKLLESDGVEKDGVLIDRSRPTALKTRVIAATQQICRVDRENPGAPQVVGLREGIAAYIDANLEKSKVVIVSDYGKGVISDVLMTKLFEARQKGRLGLGVRPLVVDPKPPNYGLYRGISVATPNRKEAEVASGLKITNKEKAMEAARLLLKKWEAEMMMITLGEDGLMIVPSDTGDGIVLDTVAQNVFDVSGAGDTVIAIFSAALAAGATARVAGDLANIGAGVVVSEVGTVAVNPEKLRTEIERLAKK